MNAPSALRIAAIFGFTGVALGALGAHGALQHVVEANQRADVWQKAVFYHLLHAAVMLTLACAGRGRFVPAPFLCFAVGVVLFSGSLYVLALTNILWLGAITPFGGLSMLGGWLWLGVRGLPD